MSEARKNTMILIEDDSNSNLNKTGSPSVILGKDVVFGSNSPSIDGSCSRDYNKISYGKGDDGNQEEQKREEPVISPDHLHAKTRYFARLEALSNMDDEH